MDRYDDLQQVQRQVIKVDNSMWESFQQLCLLDYVPVVNEDPVLQTQVEGLLKEIDTLSGRITKLTLSLKERIEEEREKLNRGIQDGSTQS